MKYLEMFQAVGQLFPRKINVTFIHGTTGQRIGNHKIGLEKLPAAFNRPTTLEVEGNLWRIIQADPIKADDFSFTKKLILHVQEANGTHVSPIQFPVPTLAGTLPPVTTGVLFDEYTMDILPEDWRQIEFLPLTMLPVIEEEMKMITAILEEEPNALRGYKRQHVREKTGAASLTIDWNEFIKQVQVKEQSNIRLADDGVQGSFSLYSDNHAYYGIEVNGEINTLCLARFDCVDDELMNLLSTYELALIDWCNGSVVTV